MKAGERDVLSFLQLFLLLMNSELLHFPSIIRHQQLLEIVIFLLAFDFFDLSNYSIIVSWSIYIADHTECNREIRTFH